jgi:hypothetical protein
MAKEVWEVTSQKRKLTEDEISILILIIAILIGGWFRFMPAWLAGFPVNDGGMFYAMMKDLKANHFVPPLYTTYNLINIPFAYPPLALYIGALISSVFKISEFEILRWLPAFVNMLTIPALYFLAKEITGDKLKSASAAFVFAFTPHLLEWLSMGGGLTRSFGTLFMMLTALFSFRMFVYGHNKYILLTILFGSLTALSHTESTVFAIALPILFWLFTSRSIRGVMLGLIVAIGVFALAGAWYGFIISRHGLNPFLSAFQTGGQTPLAFLLLFNIRNITAEPFIDLVGVIGVLGMITLLSTKRYLIVAIYILVYLVQPRSAHTIVNIPLSIAAGDFLVDTLLVKIKKPCFLIIVAVPILLANIIYHSYVTSLNHVSDEERTAFQWIQDNTPEDSRFLVLTGEPVPFCDSTSEWFPALTDRHSLTTTQGKEWIVGGEMEDILEQKANIEKCLDEGIECVKGDYGEKPDYIYISPQHPVASCDQPVSPRSGTRILIESLKDSIEYQTEYEISNIIIFKKK